MVNSQSQVSCNGLSFSYRILKKMHSEQSRGLAHSKGMFNGREKVQVKRLEEGYTVQAEDTEISGAGVLMAKGGGFQSWKEWKSSSKTVDAAAWLTKTWVCKQKTLLSDKVRDAGAREDLTHKQMDPRILRQTKFFVIRGLRILA